MIERNLTEVRSILIELGDFKAHMTVMGTRNWIPHPRGGDVHDLWRLQGLGYSEYRINIHTNQELFDWRGVDAHQEEARSTARRSIWPGSSIRKPRQPGDGARGEWDPRE